MGSQRSGGAAKTAEETDKTGRESLHLISPQQSLFTQIPPLLYTKTERKGGKKSETQQNTFGIFSYFFNYSNIFFAHCEDPELSRQFGGNPVNPELRTALFYSGD